ncbi:AAA family ATPase [Fodinibius sediminis]|uniref:AAA domain-containing protein n=1 Tax=Fodinibius sediminis TaxID=1214077 RepID=A0A521DL45_9BACT|nr:AAA family ATPase [Fodinibius sediminis]SMO72454.1 AAA domain-containing protein [Fodinibius sediminis]
MSNTTQFDNNTKTMSMGETVNKYKDMPEPETIWRGITEGDLGFVVGRSKSGKTIMCENFGFNLAARRDQFLGSKLYSHDKTVLFVPLEGIDLNDRKRNINQLEGYTQEEQQLIFNNYYIMDESPSHLDTNEKREMLIDCINMCNANVVIIDSLTRLYFGGKIEESATAQKVMSSISDISKATNATMIIIHHTPKIRRDKPMSIEDVAGSRVVAQENGFVIGINKCITGKRYVKDVAYRYRKEDSDNVLLFDINENRNIFLIGETSEYRALKGKDGRRNNTNRNYILDTILNYIKENDIEGNTVQSSDIYSLTDIKDKMSRKAFQDNFRRLTDKGLLIKIKKGEYKVNVEETTTTPIDISPATH